MHELLIIRHAIAHERDKRRWPNDADRPLTRAGARKFIKAARGIATFEAKPDEVLCSPLVRTRQTARILRRYTHFPRAQPFRELAPEVETRELISALRQRTAERVVIVGHEPCLSRLLCVLLSDQNASARFAMKKGGLAWLTFERGKARLVAFVPPKLLRSLR